MLETFYQVDGTTAVMMAAVRLAIFDGRPAGRTRAYEELYRFARAEHPEDSLAFCEELESALHMATVHDPKFQEKVDEAWRAMNSRATRKRTGSLRARRLSMFRQRFPSERDLPDWEAALVGETGDVTEKMLEDWIYARGDVIEEGLVFTGRQLYLGEGRVDLVGRDREGVRVLCEVKVSVDDRVLWQGLSYPTLYQQHIFPEKVRMLVVGPEQKPSVEEQLANAGVERFLFQEQERRIVQRPTDT